MSVLSSTLSPRTAPNEIRVVCGHCGQKYKIPAHVTTLALKCLECGHSMSPARSRAPEPAAPPAPPAPEPLRLASHLRPEPRVPTGMEPPEDGLPTETMMRRYIAAERDDSSRVSGFMFLLVGALLVGMQHFSGTSSNIADLYPLVRTCLAFLAVVLVVYDAARDGIFRGLLCVVFPPYLLLYANSHEESGWVRGLFMGTLLGVVAEAYLMPGESLILQLGPAISRFIESIDQLLEVAARPLDLP